MIKKLSLVFILILFLTSCSKIPELDKNFIISGLGFDRFKGEFVLTAEAVPLKEESEKTVFKAKGETPKKAYESLKKSLPLGIIADHTGVVILGEDLSDKNKKSIFEFLRRETAINPAVYIVCAENPEKLLNSEPLVYETVGYDIMGILKRHKSLHNRFYEIDEAIKENTSFKLPHFKKEEKRAELFKTVLYKNFKEIKSDDKI